MAIITTRMKLLEPLTEIDGHFLCVWGIARIRRKAQYISKPMVLYTSRSGSLARQSLLETTRLLKRSSLSVVGVKLKIKNIAAKSHRFFNLRDIFFFFFFFDLSLPSSFVVVNSLPSHACQSSISLNSGPSLAGSYREPWCLILHRIKLGRLN